MVDSTQRFSSRVQNYIQYRPTYPQAVVDLLKQECGLSADSVVADVGSGTGLLSKLFLQNGNLVYGIEPNREMREAGERLLQAYPRFHTVMGTAEATTLDDQSVDFVTAAQAFHWFDQDRARREFARILRPGGWVVLVWNDRRTDTTPFLVAYERLLLRYGTDYQAVSQKQVDEEMIARFYGGEFEVRRFDNRQVFDFEGLRGRLLSSSYTPEPGHPNYEPMLAELRAIFEEYEENGRVNFEYDTTVYFGHLAGDRTADRRPPTAKNSL